MEQKTTKTNRMYKEYIVLTKTGAALSSWQSHSKPHKPLKKKGGRAVPSASRGTHLSSGVPIFPNPLPASGIDLG